jgi:hypothetical protein
MLAIFDSAKLPNQPLFSVSAFSDAVWGFLILFNFVKWYEPVRTFILFRQAQGTGQT